MKKIYKEKAKRVFLTLLMISISMMGMATTYYVSNSGNDSNSGLSSTLPWQTLAKVNSITFNAGDQILFQRGSTFYGSLIINQSGTSGNPIIFGAYGTGSNPIITGFTSVTAWTNLGNNIWESTNTVSSLSYCNMVTINGANTPMGKYPKISASSTATNLALNKPVTVSSVESSAYLGTSATDGNLATRWTSSWTDNQWIYVDLGSSFDIKQIKLTWESAYASGYQIQVSNDASNWTTIYTTTANTGGTNNLTGLSGNGRYVRMYATKRATQYGVSLFEFAVYNVDVSLPDNITVTADGFYKIDSHSGGTSITSSSLTGTPNWTGADVIVRIDSWTLNKSTVTSQSGNTVNFNAIGTPYDGNGFFFQNDIRCCTQQNDWYYNPTTHKISIYSATQPTNVKVASVEKLVTIQANYINITNINFIGGNGCGVYAQSYNNNLSITNSSISNTGVSSLFLNVTGLTLENDTIIDSNGDALDLAYGNTASIRNNYFKNTGIYAGMRAITNKYGVPFAAVGIAEDNVTLEYNTIINSGYNGITFYGNNILVKNNFVDTFCTVLDDGGGIYTYTGNRTSMVNAKITGNICINGIGLSPGTNSYSGAAGIYLDEQSKNVEVYNNSVANTFIYGIQCNRNLAYINFHDNTVFNGGTHQFFASYSGVETVPTNNRISNNLFVSKLGSQDCLSFWFDSNNGVDGKTIFVNAHYLDSNYYARPIADNTLVNADNSLYTLPNWQTFSGKDIHSKGTPQTLTSVDDLQFFYNEKKAAKTITLAQPMIDVKGNKYTGSIILQPFTSLVLMKDNNPGVGVSADITAFTLPGQVGSSVINATSKTIGITMPYGTSVTSLAAIYTLSTGATVKVGTTAQVSGTTANNFASPVVYVVTAQDGITAKSWTVTVTVSASLNNKSDVTTFTLPGQVGASSINTTSKAIIINMPYGTSLTNLVASFTLSAGATAKVGTTAQVSGTTANNFASTVVYIITAQDGISITNWNVTTTFINNSYNLSNPTICQGNVAVIKQDGSQLGISYQLQSSSGSNTGSAIAGTGAAIQFSVKPSSTASYKVLATRISDGSSVLLTNTALVTVNQIPSSPEMPSGINSIDIPSVNQYTYTINPVDYADSYTWSLIPSSAGTISGSANNAMVNWSASYVGSAYIMVMASNLCGTSSSVQALKITMTKSISTDVPNLDANKDLWNPEFISKYPLGEMRIFDIQGRLIRKFKASLLEFTNDLSVVNGTYIYEFLPNNGDQPMKGKLVIVR